MFNSYVMRKYNRMFIFKQNKFCNWNYHTSGTGLSMCIVVYVTVRLYNLINNYFKRKGVEGMQELDYFLKQPVNKGALAACIYKLVCHQNLQQSRWAHTSDMKKYVISFLIYKVDSISSTGGINVSFCVT